MLKLTTLRLRFACWLFCLFSFLLDYCQPALFSKVQGITSTLVTDTYISSYSNGNYAINAADQLMVYVATAKQKTIFAIPSTKVLASQDQALTAYTASPTLNGYSFLIRDGYAYSELVNMTGVTDFKHFFKRYLVYATSESSAYQIYNLDSKTVKRVDLSSIPAFSSFTCGEAFSNHIFCLKPGSVEGYVIDIEATTVEKQNCSLKIRDEVADYKIIHQVLGYDKILVIVAERAIASVVVVTADAYYINDNKTLSYLSSIRSGFASSNLDCTGGTKTLIFNPIMGFLVRYCKGASDAPLIYNARESIFVQISETYWTAGDIFDFMTTNKYDGSLSIQFRGTAKRGVSLYKYEEITTPVFNNTCESWSRVLATCLKCSTGYLLNSSGTAISCVLNQTYIDASRFEIDLQKSDLIISFKNLSLSTEALLKRFSSTLDPKGSNIEFYELNDQLIVQNPYFELALQLSEFDLAQGKLRYKVLRTASNPQMLLRVKFKLANSEDLFSTTPKSSRRLLVASSTTKELLLQSYVHSSFDSDTLFLCLYLILCLSCQLFLIFIRPFKQTLRDSIKTFWVASAIMHIQVLCLLGAVGGRFRGPMDRVLSSCFKAMVKYLVFNAEVDFDGRLTEYSLLSPYQDLAYSGASPFLLQSRYLWVAFYAVTFALSTVGTRSFRDVMYHIRIGVLFSWIVQAVYFSISTIYAFTCLKIYSSMAVFSLIFALLTLAFIIGEFIYFHFANYPNRKFMLAFDCSRPILDSFRVDAPSILKLYHDWIFCIGAAVLIALIPNQVKVLFRALIGLGIVYILSVVVEARDPRETPYRRSFYAKIGSMGLFIFIMILLIELDSNTGLNTGGVGALSYISMSAFIAIYLLAFAIMLYRWFTPEKDVDTKPEITYKTSYAVKRYSKKTESKQEQLLRMNTRQANDDSLVRDFRKDERKGSLLDILQGSTPKGATPTPMREGKFFPRTPGTDSDLGNLKLSDIALAPPRPEASNSSRPNSDRHSSTHLAPPSPSKLLDKFALKDEEKNTNRTTDRPKEGTLVSNRLFQIKESRIEEASQLGDISSDINLDINDPTHGIREHMDGSRRVVRHSQLDNQPPSPIKIDEMGFSSQSLRPPLQPKALEDDDPNLRIPAEADA